MDIYKELKKTLKEWWYVDPNIPRRKPNPKDVVIGKSIEQNGGKVQYHMTIGPQTYIVTKDIFDRYNKGDNIRMMDIERY